MLKSFCSLEKGLIKSIQNYSTMSAGRTLQSVVTALEEFAPINTAENWDNVGLLVEPFKARAIKKIILTNDLTQDVMQEAVGKKMDMIISYHPPIFAPLKRIRQSNWKERIVSMCLAESIALYSPHTAWDAARGGVNDWLASALPVTDSKPIQVGGKRPHSSSQSSPQNKEEIASFVPNKQTRKKIKLKSR